MNARRHRRPPDLASTRRATCIRPCCRTAACCSRAGIARRAATACTCTPANPDGTDTQLLLRRVVAPDGHAGRRASTTPIEFMRAREMSDGRLMVLVRERTDVDFGGNLAIIDAQHLRREHAAAGRERAACTGPAQTPATLNDVRTIPGPSPGGRFESGFPLWDGSGRILVSWSQCRLLDVGGTDPTRIIPCDDAHLSPIRTRRPRRRCTASGCSRPSQNTILPVMAPVEGVMVTEALAAQPRNPLPSVILDRKPPLDLNPDLVSEGVGHARDPQRVRHHGCRPGARRQRRRRAPSPASRIRANAAVRAARRRASSASRNPSRIPDDDDIADPDNSAFGPTGVMREIVAYAPVEPDGSVRMKVPGQHRVPAQPARRERPAHQQRRIASLVVVGAARRSARVQRLPRAHHRQQRGGALAWTQGIVQLRLCRRHRHRRGIPRHRQHDLARGRRHHGAGALAQWLLVHRHGHDRSNAAARCPRRRAPTWSTTRSGSRPRRRPTRSSSATRHSPRRGRPIRLAIRCGGRPAASRSTTRPSARAPGTFIRCGRCRVPPAASMTALGNITFPDTCTALSQPHQSRGHDGAAAGRVARTHR